MATPVRVIRSDELVAADPTDGIPTVNVDLED